MAQNKVLKRFLEAGVSFTEMTQAKAEALVKELVKAGEVQTEQAQALVIDLVERSRKNTEALVEQVRGEIIASADAWGLATLADLDRIEKLIQSVVPVKKSAAAEKAPAAKAAAKKAPAAAGAKVKVVMLTGSRDVKAGATRTLPKESAERLIRQGHARKA